MMTSPMCFSQYVNKTCHRQPAAFKLCRLVTCSKFHKIYKFENHVTRNVTIMSLQKTMAMRILVEPNKIYINRKVLMRAIQKRKILLKLSHCVKSYGIYVKFYHNHSPIMVMSCNFLASNFGTFYF